MQIVFMGTPEFALPSLEALLTAGHQVPMVVTRPDRPRGRGQQPAPPPVKLAAASRDLPVRQPIRLQDPEFLEEMQRLQPDAIVVVAYGALIPGQLLTLPPHGCINLHPSLLPAHRGAAPIQAALLAGDTVTGVTTMVLDQGWDTGDIILQRQVPISPQDNAGTLHDSLSRIGAELLVETLNRMAAGTALRTPQDPTQASYSPKIEKEAGRIDWHLRAREVINLVRAFNPWPGAFTHHDGRLLKVLRVTEGEVDGSGQPQGGDAAVPGEVIGLVREQGFLVQTGDDPVLVREVQPANGRVMTGVDYVNGYHLQAGQRLHGSLSAPDDA